ncbi:hypothetical protein [Streptomyces griseus]|uniref:hypothetical protein n=1 Tax=Streptomyces griseus TaxID=1911 RepID=UPI0004C90D6E|nr:hypothetical protein [Streptomyces griseus]
MTEALLPPLAPAPAPTRAVPAAIGSGAALGPSLRHRNGTADPSYATGPSCFPLRRTNRAHVIGAFRDVSGRVTTAGVPDGPAGAATV